MAKGRPQGNQMFSHCQECGTQLEPPKKFATSNKYCNLECKRKARRNRLGPRYTTANKWKHLGILDSDGTFATEETFQRILKAQKGHCALCEETEKLYLDHDHKTNYVRGILCHKHNLALGILGDNIEGVSAALNYLR